jgi:hypothetical protein
MNEEIERENSIEFVTASIGVDGPIYLLYLLAVLRTSQQQQAQIASPYQEMLSTNT